MSCLRPKVIRDKKGQLQTVVCGKCPSCYYTKVGGMSFRLMVEEKQSLSSHFLTFTYAPDNIVYTPFGRRSLCKYDLQNFFKRLRKNHEGHRNYNNPIKYYAVGEYGSETRRPHYHAIVFNCDIELVEKAWTLDGKLIGDIYYGDVCESSVGYTLKYLSKPRNAGMFGDDDRQREFALSSKGIGISYLTNNMRAWHKADFYNRRYLTLNGGLKVAMPRYYYEKLYDGYERDLLTMSGSLCRQDDFYNEFISMPYEKRMEDISLFEKRVDAAFRSHEFNNSKILQL